MKDGVYPIQFCGAQAFAIRWRGKALPMCVATEREAKQLLWMLQHPELARAMLKSFMNTCHIEQPFVKRFASLRENAAYRLREAA